MVVLVGAAVVGGDRLRREERQGRDLVAGELGDHLRRHAGVGPFHLLAPALAHRQRHHHVPQQHRDVHRRVRHQRQPERDDRVRVEVQREREHHRDRIPEHRLTDLHRQRRRIQRDDLARPVHHHPPAGVLGLLRRTHITLPSPARAEPLPPHHGQRRAAGNLLRREAGEHLPHVLVQQAVLGPHADPRAPQALPPDGEDRLPDLLGDARMTPAAARPAAVRAGHHQILDARGRQPLQRPRTHMLQAQSRRLVPVQSLQLGGLRPPPLGNRRGGRVVGRPRLPGQGSRRMPHPVAGLRLPDMFRPQPGPLQVIAGQIRSARGLPGGPRRRPCGRPERAGVRVVHQPADRAAHALAVRIPQHDLAGLRHDLLNRPADTVETDPAARGQLEQPSSHHGRPPPPGQTTDVSCKGSPKSMPSLRCQSRCRA